MPTNRPTVLTVKAFKALVAKGERPENVMLLKDHNAGRFAVDPQKRQASVIVSTSAVDRDHDVIKVEGWDLDEYRKNPVVLFGHKAEDLPVAQSLDIGARQGALRSVMKFPEPGVHPFADTVYGLVKGDFLRTVSAGFRPLDFEPDSARGGMNFNKQKLVEYSVVPIPSNPEALIEAKAQGIPTDALVEWCVKMLDSASDEPMLLVPKSKVEQALTLLTTKRSIFLAPPKFAEPLVTKLTGLLTMEQGEALLEAVQTLEQTLAEIGLSSTEDADTDPIARPKKNEPDAAKNPPEGAGEPPAEPLPEAEAGPEKQPGEGDPNMPEEDPKKKPWPPKKDDAAQVTKGKVIARVQQRAGSYCVVLANGEVVSTFDKPEPAERMAASINSAAGAEPTGQGGEPGKQIADGEVVLKLTDAAPLDKAAEPVYHVDEQTLKALIGDATKKVTDDFKLKVLGQLPD
jgi:HK97 family phage prohead protease